MNSQFCGGDILSYSASTQNQDPYGFRKAHSDPDYFEALGQLWPDIRSFLGDGVPLIINAYPAFLGQFTIGINVDSYLNIKTILRAFELAQREHKSVFLIGQPLFLAEAIFRGGLKHKLPEQLLVFSGGYEMPKSLEESLSTVLSQAGSQHHFIHCYGMAELDAACLVAFERDAQGDLKYYPRSPSIDIQINNDHLALRHIQKSDQWFDSGDIGEQRENYWVVTPSPKRFHPEIQSAFFSWTLEDWRRRTGFIAPHADGVVFQLREGLEPETDHEIAYFIYAHRYGFSWLNKPAWSFL